jgi:hypothetical protein
MVKTNALTDDGKEAYLSISTPADEQVFCLPGT